MKKVKKMIVKIGKNSFFSVLIQFHFFSIFFSNIHPKNQQMDKTTIFEKNDKKIHLDFFTFSFPAPSKLSSLLFFSSKKN